MKILVNFLKWVEMLEMGGKAGNGWKWLERSEMEESFFSLIFFLLFRLLEFVKGNGFCDKCI